MPGNQSKFRMIGKVLKYFREGTLCRKMAGKVIGPPENDKRLANAYWGEAAERYVEKRIRQKTWHIEQSLIHQLLNEVPNRSTVLDVPFGTGRFAGMYLKKGMTVFGLDISRDMFQVSKSDLGPDYRRCRCAIGRADQLPYQDDSFDLIVCCRFLGLISYRMAARVLAELQRVAKSRVILYMVVHNNVWSLSRLIDSIFPVFGILPRYCRLMGGNIVEKNFLRLIERSGFCFQAKMKISKISRRISVAFYVVNKNQSSISG